MVHTETNALREKIEQLPVTEFVLDLYALDCLVPKQLYDKFRFNEPWDSTQNASLIPPFLSTFDQFDADSWICALNFEAVEFRHDSCKLYGPRATLPAGRPIEGGAAEPVAGLGSPCT